MTSSRALASGGRGPRLGREPRWTALLHRRPSWADSVFARRIAAVLLAVFAATLALRGDPGADATGVLVAAHDLAPGTVLSTADVRAVTRPAASIPGGALRDPGPIRGATLSGPVRGGEILTDLRVLGPRLAAAAAGPDARIVPIRPADSAVAEVLRAGDRVDVIAADDPGTSSRGDPAASARILATDAVVLLVTPPGGSRGTGDRIVLVALDAGRAAVVAAGSLRSALTVTLR
ncbi:SAF domain-containing protein [Nocardia stercoris]|uniref:Flagellar biosynthesis protein FlgA n=1 Tax=Nocardia stercoris TaxID=2483361 RepID=A0A3M2KTZ1_9NOCA|nr:SAF domain-containing protein [Nocardia stercoris]RMI28106.1 flagellar biosynthesis protein FlgA [Nocardia stercoris]